MESSPLLRVDEGNGLVWLVWVILGSGLVRFGWPRVGQTWPKWF